MRENHFMEFKYFRGKEVWLDIPVQKGPIGGLVSAG